MVIFTLAHLHADGGAVRVGAGAACDERRPPRRDGSSHGRDRRRAVRGRRTLCALVVGEFALASLMFVCGGLLVRAYDRVRNTDPGFDGSRVLTLPASISPAPPTPDSAKRIAFCGSAAGAAPRTAGRRHGRARLLRPGEWLPLGIVLSRPRGRRHAAANERESNGAQSHRVAGVFPGDGHPAEGGPASSPMPRRTSTPRPKRTRSSSTRPFARRSCRTAAVPVGQRIRNGEKAPWRTVVGVVAGRQAFGLEHPDRPGVYWPVAERPVENGGGRSGPRVIRRRSILGARGSCARSIPRCRGYQLRSIDEGLGLIAGRYEPRTHGCSACSRSWRCCSRSAAATA